MTWSTSAHGSPMLDDRAYAFAGLDPQYPATCVALRAEHPWQLSSSQWVREREASRPDTAQSRFTQASASQAATAMARVQWLCYGVREAASAKLTAAQKGQVKMGQEEAEKLLDVLATPVRHQEVVAKALAEGKPVPAHVLAEYEELLEGV